jgi:menaquinone-specific isochorismate synthase
MTNEKMPPSNFSSAGVPPAVSGASRPRFGEVIIHDRGRLPHWDKEGATYFITFRLADSLPSNVLDRIESERNSIVLTARQLERDLSPSERNRIEQLSTKIVEPYLDEGRGACHLRNPAVAEVVADALRYFDDRRYRLFAWCVMPNHVHVVVRFFPGETLASVIHSWKSFSAKKANLIRGSAGTFWQREYYDHLVRDESDFERAIQYVLENPAKAGLRDSRWVWGCGQLCGQDAHTTAAGTATLQKHDPRKNSR